ncbi:MAG: hypothetical protein ABII12_15985 [Planctomycetota bacterium]
MHKKVILALVTFALAVGAYLVFSSGDRNEEVSSGEEATEAVRRFVSLPTTQESRTIQDVDIPFRPGDQTLARIYDDVTGRLKYQLEAKNWEPTSDSGMQYRIKDLLIQLFMPRGQITYISADEAELVLARRSRNRLEPQSGWLRGRVKITIDRTTTEWREAHPDLADRYTHPEELIHIDMEDAKFDLDQAELISQGDVLVDGRDIRIEGVRGLTVQWDQVDNRLDILQFEHGGRMALRRGGKMVDFGLPGTQRTAKPVGKSEKVIRTPGSGTGGTALAKESPTSSLPAGAVDLDGAGDAPDSVASVQPPGSEPGAEAVVPGKIATNRGTGDGAQGAGARAMAMKPMSVKTVTADEAAAEIRFEGGVVLTNQPRSLSPGAESVSAPQPAGEPQPLRDQGELAEALASMKDEARSGKAGEDSLEARALALLQSKSRKRIHTYRAVFENDVVVEQRDGLRTIGKLESDKLEVNFDFGERQRAMTGSGRRQKAEPEPPPGGQSASPAREQDELVPLEEDLTKLVLTWDGPLELRPLKVQPAEQTGERFDAIATGERVHVESEQGTASCKQLVYRHERRQVWLAGSDAEPVELAVNTARKLAGREIFFDQKRGLALVEGAGMMVDSGEEEVTGAEGDDVFASLSRTPSIIDEADAGSANAAGADIAKATSGKKRKPVEIRWSRGVDLELGRHTVLQTNPSTGLREQKQREFLQRAWFHGDVLIKRDEEEVSAKELAVTFGAPSSSDGMADYIEHLNMAGKVRLRRGKEEIAAERLDAEMIVTPTGRNIPHIVDAEGGVEVTQPGREVRAEKMHVVMTEVRDSDRASAGDDLAILGDSRLGIESLDASGDVLIRDVERNLKVSRADSLVCSMRSGNRLVHATITADASKPFARVRFGEVAVHGHLVEVDLDRESVDVPGPGKSWMMTRKDFTGRKLRNPASVKTTWVEKMQFRMARDYGVFVGDVHSESQSFSMDCDKLTVRFGRVPPVREKKKQGFVERYWILDKIVGDRARVKTTDPTLLGRERKRPVHVVAEGHAEAMSRNYASGDSPDGEPGRLLSGLWVSGDQIVADLAREQMSVPGAGGLLIEDYQFDLPGGGGSLSVKRVGGAPLMSAVRNEGPSQTGVTWKNSMDFFLDRGLVAFDEDVEMVHCSGSQMVMREELATAAGLTREDRNRLGEGRKARLSCGHLLLEFVTAARESSSSSSPTSPVRATDLKRLIAKHAVHLQEDTKSLMGEYLQYLSEINEVRLEGVANLDARITDQDEVNQRLTMWRGPLLIWDRATNRIEAPGATIRATRR